MIATAVGTPASLKARFATYEIHLQAAAVEQALDYLVERGFDTAERSRDTGTRISIAGVREPQLGRLLEVLEGLRQHLGVDVTLHEYVTDIFA
jgi:3-deoxy-D-manno-octulosonic acid (KDO) 8-phosphate synthase